MIRLISAGLLLACAFAVSAVARRWLLGPAASVPGGLGTAGRVITGLVQVACLAAVVVVVAATLRRRRFRLLAGLAAGAVAAAVLTAGIFALLGGHAPGHAHRQSGPRLLAGQCRVPRPGAARRRGRRGRGGRALAEPAVAPGGVARAAAGRRGASAGRGGPADGADPGPGRRGHGGCRGAGDVGRPGPADRTGRDRGRAAGRGPAGVLVRPAEVEAKGSRPFAAVTADGRRLFVKALGSDQRDADLLYRAYRAVRLRNVGDTRPAASLLHAVEHQALVGLMAERAGVSAPGVDRVVRAGDTVLLVMPWAGGCSLDRLPAGQIGDDLLARLWAEVDKLHRAGIAHRSLRTANVMADPAGAPTIVDFSFSELDATPRQMDLDVAELLASLAVLAGEDRVVSAAAGVLGAGRLGRAVPLLQPLALSAATRRAVAGHDGLLTRTRAAAAAASGLQSPNWPACSGYGRGPCSPSPR